jgi:hypothetical protein
MFRAQMRRARAVGFGLLTTLTVALALPATALADAGTTGIGSGGRGGFPGEGFGLEPWHAGILGAVLAAATALIAYRARAHH